jgi:hypothetical protein
MAYFRQLDHGLHDASMISAYVSVGNSLSIVLSIAFQSWLSGRLFSRLSLSTLFGVLPLGVFALSFVALLAPPFWPSVVLMTFFQCAFRVLHFPAFRQCLLPVPTRLNHSIFSLVNLISLTATMFISGALTGLRGSLQTGHLITALLILSGGLFFALARLDTFYVANFWSFYKEKVTGTWAGLGSTDQLAEGSEEAVDDGEHREGLADSASLTSGALSPLSGEARTIWKTYAQSEDENQLRLAAERHRALLESTSSEKTRTAIALMASVGLPEFDPWLTEVRDSHPDLATRNEAARVLRTQILVRGLAGDAVPIATLRLVRDQLLRADEENRLQEALRRFSTLLNAHGGGRGAGTAWVRTLAQSARNAQNGRGSCEALLWKCINAERQEITARPLIAEILSSPFSQTRELRGLMAGLPSRRADRVAIRRAVRPRLFALVRDGFRLQERSESAPRNVLLAALYLTEWCLRRREGHAAMPVHDSLDDFETLQGDERDLLCSMHLEVLKGTEFSSAWIFLLGSKSKASDSKQVLSELAGSAKR